MADRSGATALQPQLAYHDGREASEFTRVRSAAAERFSAMGWPQTSEEEWRRSDVSSFDFDSYQVSLNGRESPSAAALPDGASAFFRFSADSNRLSAMSDAARDAGLVVSTLDALQSSDPLTADVAALMEQLVQEGADNRFVAWNAAAYTHGLVIWVPEGYVASEPVIVEVEIAGEGTAVLPRIIIRAAAGSDATVIVRLRGVEEEGEAFVCEVHQIDVAANARLRYNMVNELNIDSYLISLGSGTVARDGFFRHSATHLGSLFTKGRIDVALQGPGADMELDGLYFTHADQHMDLRTVQRHEAPTAYSRTFYKGALRDEGRSVYQGLIRVEENASGTDAYLTNNNLVLNDGARSDSIPSLQIGTNDVRCSHGSTTGRIDPLQLFYLMSRGYKESEAVEMLIEGFFDEIVSKLPEILRDELRETIVQRVREAED